MNLDARLARLERKAEKVLRCAWCRCSLSVAGAGRGAEDSRAAGGSFVWKTCRWCGNMFRLMLPDLSEREREALLLWYHTFDGETYRDERAYAAQHWWRFRWSKQALEEAADEAPPSAANPAYWGKYGRGQKEQPKESRAVRERLELKEAATAQLRKARAREERLYGPRAFPLEETLKELEKDCAHYAHLYDKEDGYRARSADEIKARRLLAYARCVEACELVLWGEAEGETAHALADLPAEVERLAEAGRAEKREQEERARREREDRERQRLERLSAASPEPPRPARRALDSDFWGQEAPDGPVMVPPPIEDIIAANCPGYVRSEGAAPRDPDGLERIVVPAVPHPKTPRDVSRLPDRLKYRAPRWDGDTNY